MTIYGPKEVLNHIDKLEGLTADLDDITDDATVELDAPLPDGAKSINPDKIKVHIDVEKDVTQTWKDVPIAVVGLPDSYKAEFVKPLEGKITVHLVGPPDVVRGLTKDDIRLYVDVGGLDTGEHQVPIQWNHPKQVQWQPSAETAMVHIRDKATAQ